LATRSFDHFATELKYARKKKEGAMEDYLARTWADLVGRLGGPMSFRFLFQPAVAGIIAIIAGVRDAQAQRPAYGWSVLTDSAHRRARLYECWSAIWKVFVVAIVLDTIYELIAYKTLFPGQTLIVAIVLAVVPYLILRGPANRIARIWIHPASPAGSAKK
jgi:hypothetical protein